jgi:hypothetical protein
MISIIISSANASDLQRVTKSIENTIGVPFEIIGIDNSDSQLGISAVYNRGTQLARYEMLCFMHEDIELLTRDWGSILVSIFEKNPQLGLVGVAGGGYKSVVPSSWYNADMEVNGEFYCNLIQGFRHSGRDEFHDYRNPRNESLSSVASIDGCWMCTKKSIAIAYPFDEALLTHFHGYDLDFSLAVQEKYTVAVTYEILLRHFSEGNFSDRWLEDIVKLHKKWSAVLPVNTDGLDESTLSRYERRAFKAFFRKSLDAGRSYGFLARIVWHSRHSRIYSPKVLLKTYVDLWRVWWERR